MKIIGITLGDPGGIGPEVALKAIQNLQRTHSFRAVVFGPSLLKKDPRLPRVDNVEWIDTAPEGFVLEEGCPTATNGFVAARNIEWATQWALEKKISGLVTAPISKTSLKMASCLAWDHTTYLQRLTHSQDVSMAFVSPSLWIVLVTVHIPYQEVPKHLHAAAITRAISHAHFLGSYRTSIPRIAVAGLNPHAGEHGLMGCEELEILTSVIQASQAKGFRVSGPHSPDTVFRAAHKGDYDVVVALYHDQGLIPVKLLHFDDAVNVTLGLPFLRTSPDHGTAFDKAYKGIASSQSMEAAIRFALTATIKA